VLPRTCDYLPSSLFTPDGCEHLIQTESVVSRYHGTNGRTASLFHTFQEETADTRGLVHLREVLGRVDPVITDSSSPEGMDAVCFFINDSHLFIAITSNVNLGILLRCSSPTQINNFVRHDVSTTVDITGPITAALNATPCSVVT
jgi:hypothetical protein